MAERDAQGRFLPGHTPMGGRPRADDVERIRDIVREVLDDETVRKWQVAMRRKLAKGNSFASEYVRDTLGGKPAVSANVSMNADLQAFMAAWAAAGQAEPEPSSNCECQSEG